VVVGFTGSVAPVRAHVVLVVEEYTPPAPSRRIGPPLGEPHDEPPDIPGSALDVWLWMVVPDEPTNVSCMYSAVAMYTSGD